MREFELPYGCVEIIDGWDENLQVCCEKCGAAHFRLASDPRGEPTHRCSMSLWQFSDGSEDALRQTNL